MKFANIYKGTEENVRLALLSLWTPGSHPMRKAIDKLLQNEPVLAEPVFQSTFGWEPAKGDDWRNSLNKEVINKLEIGKNYKPYKHQAESWKAMAEGKSIVVTSGTGSGKTECFMYPVISDLYEQEKSNAIQAIFLYPLNALMEDQKERLSKYCEATGLKFAVYNGDTPDYRADGRDETFPNEVTTREEIRDDKGKGTRPQILLTNPSMLEYILVRQSDQKMLQESAGKLRWIVIDEAHSFSGSAAVELAYQIKRILNAFNVKAEDVRFACTSATIGGEGGERSLADFIHTITGQSTSQIRVIGGNRLIPTIDEDKLSKELKRQELPAAEKVMSLRKKVNEVAGVTLRQIWDWLCPEAQYTIEYALELVDRLCELSQDGKPVLSLRAHFFMRAINGIYACANSDCKGAGNTPYGHLTTYKSATCPDCGAPLMELVQCKRCSSFVLMGNSNKNTHAISQCEEGIAEDDYFSIDPITDEDIDDEEMDEGKGRFFIVPRSKGESYCSVNKSHTVTLNINHKANGSFLEVDVDKNGNWVEVKNGENKAYCPTCGQLAMGKKLKLKHFRIPIDFVNQTIAPVLLKESETSGDGIDKPTWGKYIAFTDSRQGTAISAKTFNINVERTQCREKIMQLLAKKGDAGIAEKLQLLKNLGIEPDQALLDKIKSQNDPSLTLYDVKEGIYSDIIFEHIADDKKDDKEAYKAALIRNFIGRRPLYENNIETMGLITLEYPALKDVKLPSTLLDHYEDITEEDWHDYLKIFLDYYVRMGNHIQPLIKDERKYIRDANISTPIAGPENDNPNVNHWPYVKTDDDGKVSAKQHRMVVLLCAGLGINSLSMLQEHKKRVSDILKDAWNILVDKKLLKRVMADDKEGYNDKDFHPNNEYVGCYYLDLSGTEGNNTCVVKRTENVWECPMTRKLIDTNFRGYSPLMVGDLSQSTFDKYLCSKNKITMPQRPVEDNDVDNWIETDVNIKGLKSTGHWGNRYNETYKWLPPYIAAEHSAQQSKQLLKEYTKTFKQPNHGINVLQCSTTMEMGVDIGDIDIVLMDTIPPTASNYLQRVGRAGRKGQSKAVAFSLCNNSPIGQYAFANPMWALQTPTHMVKVRESDTIIQRHVNSFFFREFICGNGSGIQATIAVDDFMKNSCQAFIDYLNVMSINKAEEKKFHEAFGNYHYSINKTIECITKIKDDYNGIIKEMEDSFAQDEEDEKRKDAISLQLRKYKETKLLSYLSEHQFIPNANMPTGVVTFDFMDNYQTKRLKDEYKKIADLEAKKDKATSDTDKHSLDKEIGQHRGKIAEIRRQTSASRDIRTALNEYAPEQTVVVNEKNYVSAGIALFGEYDSKTRKKFIYHCRHCGNTEYSEIMDDNKVCICGNSYHGIFDKGETHYTWAYEPIGFRSDQSKNSSREEQTEKKYYDIRPVLLQTNWTNTVNVNMCQIAKSDENGEILFYNAGSGFGFAICKRCGRAAVESTIGKQENIPYEVRAGHNHLWGDSCEANDNDIARNVVLTGRHQTCYVVLRFMKEAGSNELENDEQLVFSLGVILTRALAKSEGIDESEVAFGVRQEKDSWILFIYDTAKGGCGYSLKMWNTENCQEIFDMALTELEDSPCHCEEDGGACTKCLIDRNNYRYSQKLSKAKAMDWLKRQKKEAIKIPKDIKSESNNARVVYQPLKTVAMTALSSQDVKSITFCVSDNTADYAVSDWISKNTAIGKIVSKAVENGIKVNIKVEYHPEHHTMMGDRLPFVGLDEKFPDCGIEFIRDMGKLKTAMVVEDGNKTRRYFTDMADALSFSDKWGEDCNRLFVDDKTIVFENESTPTYTPNEKEIVRQGMTNATSFPIKNYFSKAIAMSILKSQDLDTMANILNDVHVNIRFSDMYVNSALASLMFVYLLKEMQTLFDFKIDDITLQIDSPRRKCVNEKFNAYTHINMNFDDAGKADLYTFDLIEKVLGVKAESSQMDASHCRWINLTTEMGDVVEIRPDHGISGGWRSESTYMNLENLDGNVRVYKTNEDIIYYVIMRRHKI